ncbi:unnamed protein product [Cuscuta campestris]|uniref:Uncharacterized protein n=1 Tax=Cuscuta campestris TaxID=132261 RepID=A0A484LUK5_9ASTE|nr:unnamed protein product [Cuscuta campestris]
MMVFCVHERAFALICPANQTAASFRPNWLKEKASRLCHYDKSGSFGSMNGMEVRFGVGQRWVVRDQS